MSNSDFDYEYFDRYTSGDEALQREVLLLFFGQVPGLLEKFRPDVAAGDWQAAAHAIKGSARGVGLNVIGDICEAMEKLGNEPPAGKQTALTQLQAALATARACVEGHYAGIFQSK